jgi:hypothetical protein
MTEPSAARALSGIAAVLRAKKRSFAVVGGLAVSARTEPRFTRDVDLAVTVTDDADGESLVRDLRAVGYQMLAVVEHDVRKRLSTVRLSSPEKVTVDLLFASSGIEPEIVAEATDVELPDVGLIRVARAEDLLALKVLSMRDTRLQDRIDAQHLIEFVRDLDLERVRTSLALITARGYHRDQDLGAKLAGLLEGVEKER